ncbi:asparagine synthase [Laceyella sediminis]|nr:N-acetylmuramoyl-L-alanine amidase [Laceyella sediminis]PRZ11881.1 asparagine synthase [Laceyella sediminis]
MKVVIDPGHGGPDTGAVGFGLREADVALQLAELVEARLIEFVFSLPSFAKLEMSHKKRCIREGLQNTIPREIIMKPDNSFFTEIFRKGFYQEARFVNEIIQTSRAADFGWIKKDVLQDAVERFKYGFNNGLGIILKTFGLELWLRHHGY